MGSDLYQSAMRAMLQDAPEAAVIVDRLGVVRLWNDRATALLGWSDVVGEANPAIPPQQTEANARALKAFLGDSSVALESVVTGLHADGTEIDVLIKRALRIDLEDGPALAVWIAAAGDEDRRFANRNRLSRKLVAATRAEEITPVLVEGLADLLGATGGVVLRICPSGDHLHGLWALGPEQAAVESVELPVNAGPWAAALAGEVTDGEITVDGDALRARFVPMGPPGDGWVLAALVGATLDTTPVARETARAVADETWIAIQRAQLVDELDAKIEILEATTALASSVGLDLDDALVAVTTQSAEALSCERAAVYLIDEESGELSLAHVYASDAAPAALLSEGEGLALAAEVVGAGRQVLHQDVSACEAADGPWHEDAGAVAVLGLPLQVAGRTLGALIVAHTMAHPRGFTTLCQQVGAAVAQQAALAVDHARLYMTEQRTVHRLRELDRMKADWMAGLTHDLKAPLTGLLGFVETLRRLTGHVSADQQREFLTIMSRQADQLVSLVEDLLLSARIDADAVARRKTIVTMRELVADAVSGLSPEDREALTVTDDDIETTVLVDQMHMVRVLQNLLGNAFRHGAVNVAVSTTHLDGYVVVHVDDDGPGVPADLHERIFDRFSHGETAGSTGLGLYVARGIAVAHDGTLTVEDGPDGTGARFTLRLPRTRQQRVEDIDAVEPPMERRKHEEVPEIVI